MIIEHEYDPGHAHYIEVLDRWTSPRTPVWRFKIRTVDLKQYDELVDWLDNSLNGGYDYEYRFNDGSPFLSVEILEEEDALAFRLRFG